MEGRAAWSGTRAGRPLSSGLLTSTWMSRIPPSSAIAASGSSSGLPCLPGWFATALTPVALLRLGDDHCRLPGRRDRLRVGLVDGRDVVPVDLDGLPAERLGSNSVGVEVPAVHRLAGLAEPIHVDDGGQVVERVEARVLERLPHRALRHLGVAAQAPDPIRQAVELLAGQRDAHRDRQALPQGPGGHVDPRQDGRRMSLDPAAELAEGEHLLVADRAGGLVHRIQQRRRVALAEDQMIVPRILWRAEVVVEVLRHEHGHEVGGRHRRRRVAAAGGAARADRVDADLLAELAPIVVLTRHGCEAPQVVCRTERGLT